MPDTLTPKQDAPHHHHRGGEAYHWAADVFAALLASRVVVAVVITLWLGLATIPQAVDSIVTMAQENRPSAWAALFAGTLWLSVNAWFWSRVAVDPALLPAARRHGWMRHLVPRGLAAGCFLAVANALLHAASAIPPGMVDVMGEDGSGTTPLRIAAGALAASAAICVALAAPRLRHIVLWRPPTRLVVTVTLSIAALGMLAYGTAPLATARLVPPVPTILFAAAGLICGGMALAHFGARHRVPVLAAVVLGAILLADLRDRGVLPDNHDLIRVPGALPARPDLKAAFDAFLRAEATPDGPTPVVLIAAGGGGLAAADFTATILGDLADAAPDVARHIFAISAVSGGALGATEYALAARERARCALPSLRACLQAALDADFLGATVGVALYSDLLQRFLPVVLFADREAAIEHAWDAAWHTTFGTSALAAPFLDLWQAGHPWPALLLNGTSLRTGGRLVTSNLDLRGTLGADGQDLLPLLGSDTTIAGAVGTSSRFPYVSPLGVIRGVPGGPIEDWVADGGYFESLGATTALDVLNALARLPTEGQHIRFVVIEIVSDPDAGHPPPKGAPLPPLGLVGPGAALLNSRGARGTYAAQALASRVEALGGAYVRLQLGQSPTGASAPLAWSLSGSARHLIDMQWTSAWRERVLARVRK